MSIVMFIFFLMMDLAMVGIFAFVYSGKEKYSEGMILGVHIPKAEINHEEVLALSAKYKKYFKGFNLWNLIIGSLLCLLCFVDLMTFILLWSLWLCLFFGLGLGLVYRMHRKMYDLKMKHNWLMEETTHMVHVDTVVATVSDKLPISAWWNLPVIIMIFITLILPQLKEYFGAGTYGWIFAASSLGITLVFTGLAFWLSGRQNVVYSMNSDINMAVNRMEKRTWSIFIVTANYLNLLSWCYLAVEIIRNQWLNAMDFWIYIFLQILPVFIVLAGVIYIVEKRKKILSADTAPITVDDDEYWKNGWYSNPDDPHTLVQDRLCGTNYSMNMAKTSVKAISIGTAVFVAALLIGVFALLISLENTNVSVVMEGNNITIDGAMYHIDFTKNEIQSVEIIDSIPEDDYVRTNGGDTDKYLVGHFDGKETGKCMMFIYRGYTPILQIKLEDETVYVNSKTEDDVQQWYEEMQK